MEPATLIAWCRQTVQNSRSICGASRGAVDSARLTVERAKDAVRRTAAVLAPLQASRLSEVVKAGASDSTVSSPTRVDCGSDPSNAGLRPTRVECLTADR